MVSVYKTRVFYRISRSPQNSAVKYTGQLSSATAECLGIRMQHLAPTETSNNDIPIYVAADPHGKFSADRKALCVACDLASRLRQRNTIYGQHLGVQHGLPL